MTSRCSPDIPLRTNCPFEATMHDGIRSRGRYRHRRTSRDRNMKGPRPYVPSSSAKSVRIAFQGCFASAVSYTGVSITAHPWRAP